MNWKEHLKNMKLRHIEQKAKAFFEASGGYTMKINAYTDKTANGLTRAIIDWINYSGGYANRINVQGQVRVEKIQVCGGGTIEKVRYTKSTTNEGTADIHALFNGRHLSIEVKVGNDKISEAQHKEMDRITKAGGLYYVAKNMDEFVKWFNQF